MNVAIIGLGVIGGSIAKTLSKINKITIYGIDTDEITLKRAISDNVITDKSFEPTEVLPISDVVFICLRPKQIPPYIKKYSSYFKDKAVLTDVSSTKSKLINETIPMIRSNIDFIFAHPMTGSEQVGYDGSSAELFSKANVIITPISINRNENIEKIEELYEIMGTKRPIHLSPKEHDKQVSYTSHLPHALAVSLVNSSIDNGNINDVFGTSFKDMTRIANINSDLWGDIFMDNGTYLIENIENFENELDKIKTALRQKDRKQLEKEFYKSSSNHKKWFNN